MINVILSIAAAAFVGVGIWAIISCARKPQPETYDELFNEADLYD